MTARLTSLACAFVLLTLGAAAQQPGVVTPAPRPPAPGQPAPPPGQQPPPPRPVPPDAERQAVAPAPPRRMGQSVNVKVEVTISEQRGTAAPNRKIVTIVAGDGLRNVIRSQESFFPPMEVPLNIDVMPTILTDGKIRLNLNLEYDLPGQTVKPNSDRTMTKSAIRENLGMILDSGKALIVAQSADPVSDRQVTVEVRATILK